jgi:hypothetical protein
VLALSPYNKTTLLGVRIYQGRHNASHDEDGSEEGEDDGDVEESYDNIEGNTFKPLCLEFL